MNQNAAIIKPVQSGEFRTGFCSDDLAGHFGQEFMMTAPDGTQELTIYMKDLPIQVPYMRTYRSKKIFSLNQAEYIRQVVSDFLYFNEGIDRFGLGKLTTFLVNYICAKNSKITYEALYPVVLSIAGNPDEPQLDSDLLVLFKRGSKIPSKERRKASLEARNLQHSELMGKIIHNATLMTIESTHAQLSITKFRVLEEANKSGKELRSVRTMNNHILEKTERVFKKANADRYFKTEKSFNKFKKYLSLPPMSMDAASKTLAISKSTVAQFKQLTDEIDLD